MLDVAVVTAVLTLVVSVDSDLLTTGEANEGCVCLSLDLVHMKDVIHDGKIVLNPIEHKIPVRLEMHLSVSKSVQMRILAWLQTPSNIGQALFCFLKIIQHIGCCLRVLF